MLGQQSMAGTPEGQLSLSPSSCVTHHRVPCTTSLVMSSKEEPFEAVLGIFGMDVKIADDLTPLVND